MIKRWRQRRLAPLVSPSRFAAQVGGDRGAANVSEVSKASQMPPSNRSILLALVVVMSFCAFPNRGQQPSSKDVLYREVGTQKLYLDVYTPRTPAPSTGYPLVISIHGGAWEMGDRHADALMRRLTYRGFALASVDYRLCSQAKYPAQIDDVRESVRWLEAHAASYNFDTNRIFATGFSAGGHLALLLGLSQKPGDRTVKAVCALYPPTDLVTILPVAMRSQTNNPVADLLGGPVSEKLALAREASPISYVGRDSVPVLIYHGDADTLVPLAQSQSLEAAMKAAGAKCTLIVCRGQGHGFAPSDYALYQIARFFQNAVEDSDQP